MNLAILGSITGERPTVWRSPYLLLNAGLFEVLTENGVTIDSGLGVGDLKFNLPVDAARIDTLQRIFHHRPLYEIPVTCEDGMVVAEGGTNERAELQASNVDRFKAAWEYTLFRNADNESETTLLVHPTRGHGAPMDNIEVKVSAVESLVQTAKAHQIAIDSLAHYGAFWRARALTQVDGQYNPDAGYSGVIHVGALPIVDFALEFGDALASFTCAACGQTEVRGKRVVIHAKLAAGTKASFAAVPRAFVPRPKPEKSEGQPR